MKRQIVWFILLATAITMTAQNPVPLDLKGATLGMTITEFRSKHQMTINTYDGRRINKQPVCSGDDVPPWTTEAQLVLPTPEEDYAHVTHCIAPHEWTLANVIPDVLDYAFFEGRLFRVIASFNHSNFENVKLALTQKYGKPAAAEVATYQNMFGAHFSGQVFAWQRGSATLLVVERANTTEESSLFLFDSEAMKRAERRMRPKNPDL